MKSIIIVSLLIGEVIIILVLGIQIGNKIQSLKIASVVPIEKSNVLPNPKSSLRHYYEPLASNKESQPPWVKWTSHFIYETHNSDTLNERFEYIVKKPKDVFRIITLGDSFTYGWLVDTKDNWTEKLEDELNEKMRCNNLVKRWEVINLGVYGYDIAYSVERYRLRGLKYNPDLVVWFLKKDDFEEIAELIQPIWKDVDLKLKKSGEWQRRMAENPVFFPGLKEATRLISQQYQQIGEKSFLHSQASSLNEITSYYNGPLVIMTLPFLRKQDDKILNTFITKRNKSYLFDNLTDIYQKDLNATFLPHDAHPNEKGHEIIAQDLYAYLKMNKLISCN